MAIRGASGEDPWILDAPDRGEPAFKKVALDQVRRIDDLLASLGEYGEAHLELQHGQLRYINRIQSYKAWNGHDGKSPDKK